MRELIRRDIDHRKKESTLVYECAKHYLTLDAHVQLKILPLISMMCEIVNIMFNNINSDQYHTIA